MPQLIRFAILLVVASCVVGCVSMSPVPPPDGLPDMDAAAMAPATRVLSGEPPDIEFVWSGKAALVHPTLNGKDVGWFILDTGASGWTITGDAAAAAGLVPVGVSMMQGVDRTTVFRCDVARIGPVELHGLHLSGLNISGLNDESAHGPSIVGIGGGELFAAGVLEFDQRRHICRVHGTLPTRAAELIWQPVIMERGLPTVRIELPGGDSLACVLDTGCEAALQISGAAVARHDVLTSAKADGVRWSSGYHTTDRLREATLGPVIVGGATFPTVPVMLGSTSEDGEPPPARQSDGLVGMGLLKEATLWLDLANHRFALVRD